MAKYTKDEIAESTALLTALFPKGSTVRMIVRSVARSGMSRKISCLSLRSTCAETGECPTAVRDVSAHVAKVLGRSIDREVLAVVTHGCGMNMCFETAYELGRALHGDGYSLKHEVL